ncbi:MAG TPA: TetR/AcrR family transcriptional regulator [Burkholderiaceae bacterium]
MRQQEKGLRSANLIACSSVLGIQQVGRNAPCLLTPYDLRLFIYMDRTFGTIHPIMTSQNLSREEVIDRILAAFRQYGYEGASLARLSEATGLGRSSLYHHFPNGKEDMAAAALDSVATWFSENVLSALQGTDSPKKRLKRFSAKLSEFYKDGTTSCLSDVFTIGEAGTIFQKKMGERLKNLMRALAKVAEESGVDRAEAARRAESIVIAIQGSLILSRATANTAPFLRVVDNIAHQLID